MTRWGTAASNVAGFGLLSLSVAILIGPYVGMLPGGVGLTFENAGNFLTLGVVVSLLAPIIRRTRSVLLVGLVLASFHGFLIGRYSLPSPIPAAPSAPTRTLLYANLGWPSRAANLVSLIEASQPDLLLLVEYDPEAEKILASLRGRYPYRLLDIHPRPDCFGMALFSRAPGDSLLTTPDPGFPVPAIRFSPDGDSFDIWLVHTLPPSNPAQRESRERYLAEITRNVLRAQRRAVVVGDLNSTERMGCFQNLLGAGLRDSRDGRGWSPSWIPFLGPVAVLNAGLNTLASIPIDHALVYGDVEVVDRRLGPNFGSDHLPLVLQISSRQ